MFVCACKMVGWGGRPVWGVGGMGWTLCCKGSRYEKPIARLLAAQFQENKCISLTAPMLLKSKCKIHRDIYFFSFKIKSRSECPGGAAPAGRCGD